MTSGQVMSNCEQAPNTRRRADASGSKRRGRRGGGEQIRDNGVGIRKRCSGKVQMFTKVGPRTRTVREDGMGSPCAAARREARRHVWAESDGPGRGERSSYTPGTATRHPPSVGAGSAHGAARPILVVMTIGRSRDALHVARARRYRVRAPEGLLDGDSARFTPDVAFRYRFARHEWLELARHLRGPPGARGQLLVAMTGWGQRGSPHSRERASIHHLTRPWTGASVRAQSRRTAERLH